MHARNCALFGSSDVDCCCPLLETLLSRHIIASSACRVPSHQQRHSSSGNRADVPISTCLAARTASRQANAGQLNRRYETTNHLWLILEYCVGGDLMSLLQRDIRLPEPCIHDFGRDLAIALQV